MCFCGNLSWRGENACYCQKAVRLYSYYSSAIDRSPPSHAEGISLAGIGCARSSICISASVYPSSLLLFCRSEWEVSGYNTADYIPVSPQMAEFIFPQVLWQNWLSKHSFRFHFFLLKIACINLKYNIKQPISSTALKMEISANMFHHVLLRISRRMLSRKSGRWLSRCQDGSRHPLFCKYNLFCLEKMCWCVCFLKSHTV